MMSNDMRDWLTSFGFWAACVVLGALFVASCADVDQECESADECSERIPRDARILPPRHVQHIDQALLAMPGYVWTSGVVSPVQAPEWTIATGGFNRWTQVARAWDSAEYHTTVNGSLGRRTPVRTCYRDTAAPSWQPTMVCGSVAYRCPMAQVNAPLAYSNGAGSPNYNMAGLYAANRPYLWAASVFLRVADDGGGYVECLYPSTTVSLVVGRR